LVSETGNHFREEVVDGKETWAYLGPADESMLQIV